MTGRINQLEGESAKPTFDRFISRRCRRSWTASKSRRLSFDLLTKSSKHYADKRIALDLDDGVKVNYGKFGDLLAEVKASDRRD